MQVGTLVSFASRPFVGTWHSPFSVKSTPIKIAFGIQTCNFSPGINFTLKWICINLGAFCLSGVYDQIFRQFSLFSQGTTSLMMQLWNEVNLHNSIFRATFFLADQGVFQKHFGSKTWTRMYFDQATHSRGKLDLKFDTLLSSWNVTSTTNFGL